MFARSDNKGADCEFRIAQEVAVFNLKYFLPEFILSTFFSGRNGFEGIYDKKACYGHQRRHDSYVDE